MGLAGGWLNHHLVHLCAQLVRWPRHGAPDPATSAGFRPSADLLLGLSGCNHTTSVLFLHDFGCFHAVRSCSFLTLVFIDVVIQYFELEVLID